MAHPGPAAKDSFFPSAASTPWPYLNPAPHLRSRTQAGGRKARRQNCQMRLRVGFPMGLRDPSNIAQCPYPPIFDTDLRCLHSNRYLWQHSRRQHRRHAWAGGRGTYNYERCTAFFLLFLRGGVVAFEMRSSGSFAGLVGQSGK